MFNSTTINIIDGNNYIYRAYYAMKARKHAMTNDSGFPTGALYGFTKMLFGLTIESQFPPSHAVVVLDPPGPNFRHNLFPLYKANRAGGAHLDLDKQRPYFPRVASALGMPVLQVPGYEADDVIATLVKRFASDAECAIYSSDKDLLQLLVYDGVVMRDTMKGKQFGLAEVQDKFGVTPDLIADVLALAGDTSDNVPGVPGIGIKTAAKLLAEYGSLDGVLANATRVSGKKRSANLVGYAHQARLSYQLVTLRYVDLQVDLDGLKLKRPDKDRLAHMLDVFGFSSLKHHVR